MCGDENVWVPYLAPEDQIGVARDSVVQGVKVQIQFNSRALDEMRGDLPRLLFANR